ncbi:MAG: hypothetical protein U0263_38835 [Polyangiaceae bacterium]
MRQSSRLLLGSALVAGSLLCARELRAQVDINPPPPNVLLLVDSSGSMEYKSSSSSFPVCDPTQDAGNEKSRWIELIEVMTGSIEHYRCDAVDRSSNAFNTEFALAGNDTPDRFYSNPYHRPMSKDCTPGPGTLPGNPFAWANIDFHKYNDISDNCNFNQQNDGLLDDGAFRKTVRFGLMTFDTHADPGVGVSARFPSTPRAAKARGATSSALAPPASLPAVSRLLPTWRSARATLRLLRGKAG